MSDMAYLEDMKSKRLVWLRGEVKTPPVGLEARRELGFLLRQIQEGDMPSMPYAKPMREIGPNCLELRVNDKNRSWRLVCSVDDDDIVVLDVFSKTTQKTPHHVVENCKRRLSLWEKSK